MDKKDYQPLLVTDIDAWKTRLQRLERNWIDTGANMQDRHFDEMIELRTQLEPIIAAESPQEDPDLETALINQKLAEIDSLQVQAKIESALNEIADDEGNIDFDEARAKLRELKDNPRPDNIEAAEAESAAAEAPPRKK